jgi:non-specific serine/threonine protein kinase
MQAMARRVGDPWGECRGLEALARQALRAGDLEGASAHLAAAIEIARGIGDTWSLAMALNELGDVERARGAHRRALALYHESRALFSQLGLGAQPTLVHNLGYAALAIHDHAQAAAHFVDALVEFRRVGARRGMAECFVAFGCLSAAQGRVADAARLFGAGEAGLQALRAEIWPANRPTYEHWLSRARSRMRAAEFDQAWAEGRELPLEQATVLALESTTARPRPAARVDYRAQRLTPRERELAELVAQGFTNRQIADALVIAEKTVANHLQRVLEKLDLRTRTQLAARAAAFGLATSR